MKSTAILNVVILGLALAIGGAGCKKKPTGITNIPGFRPGDGIVGRPGNDLNTGPGTAIAEPSTSTSDIRSGEPIPFPGDHTGIEGRPQNRDMFAADTVYFALDSATVKPDQKSKLESVASSFKSQAAGDLLIEGHCDERGTEGYNLTLGDKRANALREYLVNLGVSADRVHTVSFGEAKPAVVGNDESAYSRNRRGEFIFIEPAK
jgi:peptidoglycan-associated lipoprotein